MAKAVKLTEQQRAVVMNRGGNLLVSAAAGSGKTKVLVDRIMEKVCEEKKNITDFLVITYTRAAAAELRAKITSELSKRLATNPSDTHIQAQLHLVYAAQISTVHAFCANLLHSDSALAGLSPDFRVAEEAECKVLKYQAMEDLLESVYRDIEKHPDVKAFIEELAFGRDDSAVPAILYGIYDTVQSHPWPEEWVGECLNNMDVSSYKDAAETPWGHYLMEVTKAYVRSQLPLVQTARDTCDLDAVLSEAYSSTLSADVSKMADLLAATTWDQLYMLADTKWARLSAPKKGKEFSATLQASVKSLRERYKKGIDAKLKNIYGMSAEVLEDLQKTEASIRGMFRLVAEFTRRYEHKKELHNVLDFSDLEHYTIRLLLDPETHARTDTAAAIARSFEEIMVDEYQDSNEVQETIFSAISNGTNRFMVGDVKQSIYMFRLADPSIFLRHYSSYRPYYAAGEGDPRKIVLAKNFRSRPEILEATNAVMSTCMSPEVGGVTYGEEEALVAGRTDFLPASEPVVELAAINMPASGNASEDDDADEEEGLAKTDVEARYVAGRIKDMLDHSTIMDEETGSMRKVRADDIAILLRSTKNSAPHYIKALAELGIATKASRNGSIMDTTEVATLYAYLQVIDNPRQDIPLVAAMASPLVGFTADDLAKVRMAKKDAPTFYDALLVYAEDNTRGKSFVEQLQYFRTIAPYTRLSVLYSEVLLLTDAEDVFGSMPNGEQRMANVQRFGEMIASFEAGGARRLFDYLAYMESLREQGVELPQASAGTLVDEAVSVLSIHASKGLEYPIVFLSDMSRRFNTSELKGSALLHRTLGAGVQVVDKELMYRYPTIARTAIATCAALESKSEELRILYVAMTRAKQKLVMTYCDRLQRTLARLAAETDNPLPPAISQSVRNPGEWVMMTALNRREADALYKVTGQLPTLKPASEMPWAVSVVDASDVGGKKATLAELESTAGDEMAEDAVLLPEAFPGLDEDQLRQDLEYTYPHTQAIQTPAKGMASSLFARGCKVTISRPSFSKRKEGYTAAEHGTATHMFMQYADFGKCASGGKKAIRDELVRLTSLGYLSKDEANAVLVDTLTKLFASAVGKELASLPTGQTMREHPFTVIVPSSRLYGADTGDDGVVLQGIVDLFTVDAEGIRVYDYKTDWVSTPEEEAERVEMYRPQINLYADALSEIYQMPVLKQSIIFLRSGHAVAV